MLTWAYEGQIQISGTVVPFQKYLEIVDGLVDQEGILIYGG